MQVGTPGDGVLAGWVLGNWGWVQSKSEEPEDRHWTLTVVGAVYLDLYLLV